MKSKLGILRPRSSLFALRMLVFRKNRHGRNEFGGWGRMPSSAGIVVVALAAAMIFGNWLRADETPSAVRKLPAAVDRKVDFEKDILPILSAHCHDCHGADLREAGLRLDRRSAALAGGDSGKSIVAGKSAESRLIHYVAGLNPNMVMPPDGDPLSPEQIGLLRAWIDQGAHWPDQLANEGGRPTHWSYQPIVRPELPQTKNADWVRTPIDVFVLARLEEAGIEPSPEADRYTLIRRLNLDLLGLPPTPEEVDAFVNDPSPNAYETLVDRLLRSPHFGERWGRHWLDKARYADSDGYEKDRPRPDAWRWRDWVIKAVNADMPFDQFTIEQLAGDLLPEADASQILATAFHRQTLTNTEGGVDQEEFRVEAVFDRVETTGTVWLGLTIGCARCHSHKYDAISQREYYQLFAFLNNGDEVTAKVPVSETAMEKFEADLRKYEKKTRAVRESLAAARKRLEPKLAEWEAELRTAGGLDADASRTFQPLEIVSIASDGGVKFERLDDGSYRAGGKNPATATYTVVARTDLAGITGFRLETLADDKLPSKGPGRTPHGNFVLSEFEVFSADNAKLKNAAPVPLHAAQADFSQNDWPVANAIDGKKEPKNGWAISPKMGADHWATFDTGLLTGTGSDAYLKFVLSQPYGSQHTIGRFRITATTDLPDDVRQILAVAADQRDDAQKQRLLDYYAGCDPETAALARRLAQLERSAPKPPLMTVRVIGERTNDRRTTHILRRGDFLQPGEPVEPAALDILHDLEPAPGQNLNRLALARWLVSPENPLTPRVAVNHIWSHLFGDGLVRTPYDFGVRGERPTHPELLDWLATEFLRVGWSRKAMIKLIVMSSTYRQASAHRPELAEVDPTNRLLARQNRIRVEAEIIRDLSLAASGLLSRKIGGPSVYPPMPKDVAALSYANNFKWNTSKGEDRYRRGMYTFFKRTAPHPNLTTFDCPDSNTTCVERTNSNTPLQALTTLNNETFVEAAQALARRILSSDRPADVDRLTYAFRLCVARPPTDVELDGFLGLLADCRAWYADHPDQAKQLAGDYAVKEIAGNSPADLSPVAESAAWMATTRIMMNLDAFITRE